MPVSSWQDGNDFNINQANFPNMSALQQNLTLKY
jgi:alpha-glucosidase (family GH31 glycosyl hydrolase)